MSCKSEDITFIQLNADTSSQMPISSMKSLISALLAELPEDTSPAVIVVKPDQQVIGPANEQGSRSKGPIYDPTIVYVLELATILALRDIETVENFAKEVGEALQTVIRNSSNVHPIVISRAVFYLLSLLRASQVSIFVQNEYFPLTRAGLFFYSGTCHPPYHIQLEPGYSGDLCPSHSRRASLMRQPTRITSQGDDQLARFLVHPPSSPSLEKCRGSCF